MELILFIIFIAIAISNSKKKDTKKQKNYSQMEYSRVNHNDDWQKTARANIEKAKQFATAKLQEVERQLELELEDEEDITYDMPKRNVRTTPAHEQVVQSVMQQKPVQQKEMSAMEQVHAGRMEARNTTILQRAKANAQEDREDVTLKTMEAEHNHSERVSPASHHHPEDIIPENMLGSLEDLMVKGYDGNLCFERDFVGEAMDMISRFTVPSDIPNGSEDDVA